MSDKIKVLLTGGTGFIGNYFVNTHNYMYDITNVGRNKNLNCSNIFWDLRSPLHTTLMDIPDVVIHSASIVNDSNTNNLDYIDINVKSTLSLIEFCLINHIKKFIFISSGAVYGFGERPFSEKDSCNPQGMYSLSKYFSEMLCELYKNDLSITILRLFFPYGEGQKNRLINRLFFSILNDIPVTLNPDGLPKINPVHVSDVINILKIIIERNIMGTFNVCGDDIISIEELCQKIALIANKNSILFSYNQSPTKNLIGDNSNLYQTFSYKLQVNLQEGLTSYFNSLS